MNMSTSKPADWLVPGLLLILCVVPAAAGVARLVMLGEGGPLTPDNARFFAAPWPVALHIVSAIFYSVIGAFQFAPALRRRRPGWHRASGRMLVPTGLVAALSGIWMTLFYPHVEGDSVQVYWIRLLVGWGMVAALLLGFAAIRRREISRHRAWMMRAYALGMGAGTQVVLGGPLLIAFGSTSEFVRTLYMAGGWGLNLAIAEWLIHRGAAARPLAVDNRGAI